MRKFMALLAGLSMVVFLATSCGDSDDGGGGDQAQESSGESTPGLDPDFVELFQTQLAAIGCYDGPVDGIDGAATTAAIVNFQRAQGLGEDGVVGPETEEALRAAVDAGVEGCSADGE